MKKIVDGTERINFFLEFNVGQEVEESGSLLDYGWAGEQGKDLDDFLKAVYLEFVFDHVSGSVTFEDESLEDVRL